MADYTMCADDDCPYSKQCLRHPHSGVKPKLWFQQWAQFPKQWPQKPENCDGWMPKK